MPKSQSQRHRFIDAAKSIDADETGEAFDKAFGKIVPPVKKTAAENKQPVKK